MVESQGFQEIPIIDISALFLDVRLSLSDEQDQDLKLGVGQKLHAACRDVGFFYIEGHGLDDSRMKYVLQAARTWFALPEAIKKEISLSAASHYRGYQPLGVNITKYEAGFSRDWHEGIDFYREGQTGSNSMTAVHGLNLWPSQIPSFEKLLRTYFQDCLHLGQILMRGISLGLGLPEDYFEKPGHGGTTAETSYWVARVLHYPPLSQGSSHQPELAAQAAKGELTDRSLQLSCGEHSDYGLLTLVNQQDGLTALQVKNQTGQWIDAKPIPGTLVCNIGDMLKIYTNGLYTPTLHRVINADPTVSRISIPFFYECAFETEVAPIPELKGRSQSKAGELLQPIKYGQHLLNKVTNNFDFEEKGPPISA